MEKALDRMVDSETISGFKCEACEETVELKKRSLISKLPPTLLLVANRFVFNFETLQNEKLNTRCGVPWRGRTPVLVSHAVAHCYVLDALQI